MTVDSIAKGKNATEKIYISFIRSKKTSINESGILWCYMARHKGDSVKCWSRKSMWAQGSCHSSVCWSKAAQRTRAHTTQSICVHEIWLIVHDEEYKSNRVLAKCTRITTRLFLMFTFGPYSRYLLDQQFHSDKPDTQVNNPLKNNGNICFYNKTENLL